MSSGERHRGEKTGSLRSPLIFIFARINRSVISGAEARRGSQKVGRWSVDWNKGTLGTSLVGRCIALGASYQISIAKISSYAS